ncbi:acyl-CoA desaturase [Echinicola sp. CAU 1574]|uniref:Acyl-CoA desaturase n=1 Tax=Echinicola arenosa TaxID=2774144 RepID=A0ABR9AJY8_9BACT|nr:acyl-CoA desaturase [Echinicola arenosa]MBD8488225.1 acyl-CoA desaturase [Echinicola arenosa]
MKNLKFTHSIRSGFDKTLRTKVNNYFEKNNISRYGNGNMIVKTVIMLSIFFIPLIFIGSGMVENTALLFTLYITSGFGMAGVGMGVMHDAIHGSYSKSRAVNRYLGYTMNLIGANSDVWKIQHNVLHHTYTNIEEGDDDINVPFFLRFSPHAKHYWIHRFQYLYVWLFYGLSTISWITLKDFVRACRYNKMGFFDRKSSFTKELLKIAVWKIIYYSYALFLPLIMVPLPAYIVVLAFLGMHFVTGICISLVFQTAHIVPGTEFIHADKKGQIHNEWTLHQLATTSNYAPKSTLFSWLIGGLNFQVEHHLFPNICHVHYKKLSGIVSRTAKEYNLPYNVKKSFFEALLDHIKMLRQLGIQQI